jgi:hypothetical protein
LRSGTAHSHCCKPATDPCGCGSRLPPAVKRCFAERVDKASGQRLFDIARGLHKQGRERAVLLDQDAMFVEPSLELLHQIGAIRAPREPGQTIFIVGGADVVICGDSVS